MVVVEVVVVVVEVVVVVGGGCSVVVTFISCSELKVVLKFNFPSAVEFIVSMRDESLYI